MYDIRQFKPTLYILLFLGLSGFCVAAEEPGLWLLAGGALLVNAWLIWKRKFKPLPRWLANTVTLGSMLFVTDQVLHFVATPILLIGQFLVFLQIVKLFEQRANRDYAQLLMLSFLLMVSAAISTARLAFAIIFFPYLVLLLYGCLLFHLKVESERAKAAQDLPDQKLNAATLRQDQRFLGRSMRRLTGLVTVVSLGCAVAVFFFFPRGSAARLFGQIQLRSPEVLTGFSDDAQLNQVARITENNSLVATVRVMHKDKLVTSGSLALRGVTFDEYISKGRNGPWHWHRTTGPPDPETPIDRSVGGDESFVSPVAPTTDEWVQTVRLEPIGSVVLPALAGVRSFRPHDEVKLRFHPEDEILQRLLNVHLPLTYEVVSNNALSQWERPPRVPHSEIAPEIFAFARDPEVCGLSPAELARRSGISGVTDLDDRIAGNIERYFKTHFSYTLDLTDAAALFRNRDPLAVFVSRTKRGHCEYFAGAMTLACQSLGMRARIVHGFNTDEYNRYSEVFQVRQSHAHAWVEVLTAQGWKTFDPTSGREFPPNESRSGVQLFKHVFDWLEFKWGTAVVAYDGSRRENLINNWGTSVTNAAIHSQEKASTLSNWWASLKDRTEFWTVSAKLLAGFITMMATGIVGLVLWFLVERYRIRRRAAKIGLDALPMTERIRLARQLGFYDQMMEALRRRRIVRPRHLTHQEFCRTLAFLPTDAYETIDRLTRIFYRVRYGGAHVQLARQRRLARIVSKLETALGPEKGRRFQ
jgi:transglutaminase-like putative cysteine protease